MNNFFRQRRQLLMYLGLGVMSAGAATAFRFNDRSVTSITPTKMPATDATLDSESAALPSGGKKVLPNFEGISQWLNSAPLSVAELKGQVVLVQFWTFACINCQRTLPHITQWHRQYAAQGLKVIGIHTPEFAFERDINTIKRARCSNTKLLTRFLLITHTKLGTLTTTSIGRIYS